MTKSESPRRRRSPPDGREARRHVAVWFRSNPSPLYIQFLQGMVQFAQDEDGWRFWFPGGDDLPEVWEEIYGRRLQGVITPIATALTFDALRRIQAPIVNVSNRLPIDESFPRVTTDDLAVGRLVGDHFLERGFRHFLFLPSGQDYYTALRRAGFQERIMEAGYEMIQPEDRTLITSDWRLREDEVEQWLEQLPLPLAVMGANDHLAATFINAALAFGYDVPGEISVVGVDNDPVKHALSAVPLSSMALAGEKIGYNAMALLSGLIGGGGRRRSVRRAELPLITVPPACLVIRRSSDVMATEDQQIAGVIRHIIGNVREPLYVEELCRQAGLSRRTFERRFRKATSSVPYQFIIEERLRRARQMLTGTTLSLAEVAERCGLGDVNQFTKTFTQRTGESPGRYRRSRRV